MGKRAFDVVVATLGLVATSPLLAVIAVAIKLDSRGPVLYRSRRVGKEGEHFTLHKFRTMRIGDDGPRVTSRGDSRITRVGRLLRATKLDELPQLWDVLGGHMSLVGPRPEDPHYVELYDAEQRRVLTVRPGITGPSAIEYRHEERLLAASADPEQTYVDEVMPAKLAQDLRYIETRTFWGDLTLLLRTLLSVLKRHDEREKPER